MNVNASYVGISEFGVELSLPSKLLQNRIIFLTEPVAPEITSSIIAQLLYLESEAPGTPINFYINSPGGYVTDGLAIYDTMQYISSPVNTICVGLAASMAAVLLSAGKERYALPHSSIMIHQPSGEAFGQASDVLIQAKLLEKNKQTLAEILSKHTNKSISTILTDMDRDFWMSPEDALSYNIIDNIKCSY